MSKNPLGVEQLDKTECRNTILSHIILSADLMTALAVSGEAVQAEFERMLRPRITQKDYPKDKDLERAIFQICRKFKEEKKKCGASLGSISKTWNCPVTGLKANSRKGFEKDCMKFDR